MNDADFEETFAVPLGMAAATTQMAGNVMIGWSQESLTGDLTLSAQLRLRLRNRRLQQAHDR